MRTALLTIASSKATYLISIDNDSEGDTATSSKNIRIYFDSYSELKKKLKEFLTGVDIWGTTDKAAASVPDFAKISKTLLASIDINSKAPLYSEISGDIHVLLVSCPSPEIDMVI